MIPVETSSQLLSFLNHEMSYAIVGVSSNKQKFGRLVYEKMVEQGYKVVPVHPTLKQIDGNLVYNSLEQLPPEVERAVILTHKKDTPGVVKECVRKGITSLWIQQQSESPEVVELCEKNSVKCITGHCIFMVIEPVSGFHKLHRSLLVMVGKFPRKKR